MGVSDSLGEDERRGEHRCWVGAARVVVGVAGVEGILVDAGEEKVAEASLLGIFAAMVATAVVELAVVAVDGVEGW